MQLAVGPGSALVNGCDINNLTAAVVLDFKAHTTFGRVPSGAGNRGNVGSHRVDGGVAPAGDQTVRSI